MMFLRSPRLAPLARHLQPLVFVSLAALASCGPAAQAASQTASSVPAVAAPAAPLSIDVYTASAAGFRVDSTLITGPKEAVLVDAQFTRSDAHRLAAMILESGKTLTTIFITHAHPDHYFGLKVLLQQFPHAKVVATPAVVEAIKVLGPQKLAEWKPVYGANLADRFVVPEPLVGHELTVDGQTLRVVDVNGGESDVAAAVYVPALTTLIAGDLLFNHVHLWLAEGRAEPWIQDIAAIRAVGPISRVIAGHKKPDAAELPTLLDENVRYIRAFLAIKTTSKDAAEALARIQKAYPDYELPVIAQIAFTAVMK